MTLPGHIGSSGYYFLDHLPEHRDNTAPIAVNGVMTPGTFAALGIPLKAGRDFNDGDTRDRPWVAIVNEALVRQSIPAQDPIGRTIYCGFDSERPMTIIGLVGDVREKGPAGEAPPECYMSNRQHFYNNTSLSVVVRTAGDPMALESTVRRMAHDRSPDVPVTFTTLGSDVYEGIAAPRFRTILFTVFAALAVVLAMAGVYGVNGVHGRPEVQRDRCANGIGSEFRLGGPVDPEAGAGSGGDRTGRRAGGCVCWDSSARRPAVPCAAH